MINRQALLDEAIRRVIANNGLLEQIREEYARLVVGDDPSPAGEHEHIWFKVCSWPDPPVDVFDCGCGARGLLRRHFGASPDVEILEPSPTSADNALNVLPELQNSRSALELQNRSALEMTSGA